MTETLALPELSHLPTELLTQIFTFTTVHNSGTLRSLLRVSRLFHDICVPLKYQCTSLTTNRDVQRFLQELEALESQGAPIHLRRILHLYISVNPPDRDPEKEGVTIAQIFRILATAAPTLQSLTFIYQNTLLSTCVLGRIFRQALPVLKELTIHGFYPFPSPAPMASMQLPIPTPTPTSDAVASGISTSIMPQLERLHLGGNRNPHGLLQLGCLDECFPSLTHLCVSGIVMAGSFVDEVKRALEELSLHEGSNDKRNAIGGPLARLPPHLDTLVIQPGFMPPSRPAKMKIGMTGMGGPAKKDQWMMDGLKEIEESMNRRPGEGIRFSLKERLQDPNKVLVGKILYDDWIGRMNGAEGCWR